MKDVAQQFGWACAHLVNGHALKGKATTVLLQVKSTGDTVLITKAPVATNIVPSLLRYYHLKFKNLIPLGKPINGSCLTRTPRRAI